ncbi:MAG TPA: oxygen-independent coproporphyrinogen III oxidase [Terriglobales bacterium]|nr:oxygen-independent coproporphyrinogen III oxidase [Terriglobales bacterium]
MDASLIAKYDRPVPRYTSYPTAPHFHAGIGPADYVRWLQECDAGQPLSLYLHVPYCRQMCWYCGCHTKIVARQAPIDRFVETLHAEIDLIADILAAAGSRRRVSQIHWGGGTPNVMLPAQFTSLMDHIARRFDIDADAVRAVELDPRWITNDWLTALQAAGVNRASLGVQDFDPTVQIAINRPQSFELVRNAMAGLRAAGIGSINLDLLYGLPHQTLETLAHTVDLAAALAPERISLFGYAHVPWMKANQKQIDENVLPDVELRWRLQEQAARQLQQQGYRSVGLDHFARPDDHLAMALVAGALQRNFQGYTTDDSEILIGLGPSAIGSLPAGYVQNAVATADWQRAISAQRTAVSRGIALTGENRARRDIINAVMCTGEVNLAAIRDRYPDVWIDYAPDLERLRPLLADGLIEMAGNDIRLTERGRPLMRVVAACFDRYLHPAPADVGTDAMSPAMVAAGGSRVAGRYSRVI